MGKNASQRFWTKVCVKEPVECWPWQGAVMKNGYGRFGKTTAHRAAFVLRYGPVADHLVIDHLCRSRDCCNPDHLEAVTNRENAQRGARGRMVTTCKNGHAYTPANTVLRSDGRRACKECRRKWNGNAYRGRDAAYWRNYRIERKRREQTPD